MIETNKKTKKPHRERKNPGERDRQAKRRQATNAARGKQVWVPSSFTGTMDELNAMTDAEVLTIVPGHWERQ